MSTGADLDPLRRAATGLGAGARLAGVTADLLDTAGDG